MVQKYKETSKLKEGEMYKGERNLFIGEAQHFQVGVDGKERGVSMRASAKNVEKGEKRVALG